MSRDEFIFLALTLIGVVAIVVFRNVPMSGASLIEGNAASDESAPSYLTYNQPAYVYAPPLIAPMPIVSGSNSAKNSGESNDCVFCGKD